jgi:Transglutaminase-like superfamily
MTLRWFDRFRVLHKFFALSRLQQKTLLLSSLVLPVFWLALRWPGFARWQAWLQTGRPSSSLPTAAQSKMAREMGAAVNMAAARSPFPVTCLSRSMLLDWLLRRRGIASELCIGVQITNGVFAAHAWVQHEGIPVNDLADVGQRYAAFSGLVLPVMFKLP